jgi:hypothetical protein
MPEQVVKPAAGRLEAALPAVCKVASFTIGIGSSAGAFAGGQNGGFWLKADSGHFTTNTPRQKAHVQWEQQVTQGKTRIVQIARAWIGWGRVEGYRRLPRFSTVD